MNLQRAIHIVPPQEGAEWNLGIRIQCKVSSETTGNLYCVLELVLPPQAGAPLHVHRCEEELFYVLEGECLVGTLGKQWTAPRGTTVVFPKGTPHYFRNVGEVECRVLITAVPGGLDQYFEAFAAAVNAGRVDEVAAINERYQILFFQPMTAREGEPLPDELAVALQMENDILPLWDRLPASVQRGHIETLRSAVQGEPRWIAAQAVLKVIQFEANGR